MERHPELVHPKRRYGFTRGEKDFQRALRDDISEGERKRANPSLSRGVSQRMSETSEISQTGGAASAPPRKRSRQVVSESEDETNAPASPRFK